MSRKHYQLLAEAISKMKSLGKDQAYVADMIAEALKSDNARFDYARFMTACGIE